jgi:hypothetical protein
LAERLFLSSPCTARNAAIASYSMPSRWELSTNALEKWWIEGRLSMVAKFVNADKTVPFKSTGEVYLPKLGKYVGVPIGRLDTLMNRIITNSKKHDRLESVAFALIWAGISTLVATACLWASVDYFKIVDSVETINKKALVLTLLVGFFGFLQVAAGAISYYAYCDKKNTQETVYNHILEDMDEIKRTCFPVDPPFSQPETPAGTEPSISASSP